MNWTRLQMSGVLLLLAIGNLPAQLRLSTCVRDARENYPLSKQYDLIRQTEMYNIKNAGYSLLPQISLSGRATYQSEVTDVSKLASTLGLPTKGMSKDQYNLSVEVQQSLWDGGQTRNEQARIAASSKAQLRNLDVELYALEERVEQVYFGILLQDVLLKQNANLKTELDEQRKRIASSHRYGAATTADIATIEVELLRAESIRDELVSKRKAYIEVLGLLIGQRLNETTTLSLPEELPLNPASEIGSLRPEYQLLEAKAAEIAISRKQAKAALMPKLSAFAQGGYGRPGLNMLDNTFSPYYMAGIRLGWNVSAFYTHKNKLTNLNLAEAQLSNQRALLDQQIEQVNITDRAELQRLAVEMKRDSEIIALRESIKQTAIAKHSAGTMTVSDLVREVQAEASAREQQEHHRIEWLRVQYKLRHNTNTSVTKQ